MNRAERRTRTTRKVNRRAREWESLMGEAPDAKRRGRMKDRHPFDCGTPQCYACTKKTTPTAYRERNA